MSVVTHLAIVSALWKPVVQFRRRQPVTDAYTASVAFLQAVVAYSWHMTALTVYSLSAPTLAVKD